MKLNEITIEITQQCPNHCMHCSSLSCPTKTTCLSLQTVREVVDDAVSLGCESICLSGGEPFLHPELLKIVNHIAEHNIQCNIYTSGICYVEREPVSVPVDILESLKGKVGKYIVNVESSDETTYYKIMGTSFHGYGMMKQFISDAVAMGEVVEAHFVPMKLNYRQIPSVVEMCNQLGISKVSFLRFVAQGRGLENKKDLLLNVHEMSVAQRLMRDCAVNNSDGIRLGIPFSDCKNKISCLTGKIKLDVRYDGNVYPCEAFKNDQPNNMFHASADNVNTRGLLDIYHNSQYLNEVRCLLESFQQVNACETCLAQYLSNQNI